MKHSGFKRAAEISPFSSGGRGIVGTGRCTYVELVAANIVALDIAHETIILPVLCLTDGSPSSTILDRRQGIWCKDEIWLAGSLQRVDKVKYTGVLTVSGHSGRRQKDGSKDLHFEWNTNIV